jgi:chromosomal replication initiation ATPase DnaA
LQIPLPLSSPERFSRDDLIVCPGNAQAIAYVDSWPGWPVPVVVLHGPRGCGKTHLASLWRDAANAVSIDAARVAEETLPRLGAVIVEDVDSAGVSPARDAALFGLLGRTKADAPLLLTGRTHPATWPVLIPDLASRFAAIPALALWAPDEALLAALARKLFCDRQLYVPDTVIDEMLRRLDRSPGAIRDFVADLDAAALAAAKPINLALVRSFIAARADTL